MLSLQELIVYNYLDSLLQNQTPISNPHESTLIKIYHKLTLFESIEDIPLDSKANFYPKHVIRNYQIEYTKTLQLFNTTLKHIINDLELYAPKIQRINLNEVPCMKKNMSQFNNNFNFMMKKKYYHYV